MSQVDRHAYRQIGAQLVREQAIHPVQIDQTGADGVGSESLQDADWSAALDVFGVPS